MMEESELSKLILKFKIAYPQFFRDMTKEDILGLIAMYKEQLNGYSYNLVSKAVDKIISKNKYMPSMAEIIDECNSVNVNYLLNIVKVMYDDGYFHRGVERLSDDQANRNYDKTINWLEKGIIPSFLKADIEEYMKNNEQIDSQERKFLC